MTIHRERRSILTRTNRQIRIQKKEEGTSECKEWTTRMDEECQANGSPKPTAGLTVAEALRRRNDKPLLHARVKSMTNWGRRGTRRCARKQIPTIPDDIHRF